MPCIHSQEEFCESICSSLHVPETANRHALYRCGSSENTPTVRTVALKYVSNNTKKFKLLCTHFTGQVNLLCLYSISKSNSLCHRLKFKTVWCAMFLTNTQNMICPSIPMHMALQFELIHHEFGIHIYHGLQLHQYMGEMPDSSSEPSHSPLAFWEMLLKAWLLYVVE